MRSLKAVGLGTAVALSALIVCASGADAADRPSTRSETKFSLIGKATGQTVVDVAQDGHVGPGDYVVFTEDLLDSNGNKVGSDSALCTIITEAAGGEAQCTFTFSSNAGDITAQSASFGILTNEPKSFDAAVTGGTKDFVGVRGSIHGSTDSPTQVKLDFDLFY